MCAFPGSGERAPPIRPRRSPTTKGMHMPSRLKATFGLSLLVALAITAMSAMSASAKVSGHFTSSKAATEYKAIESTASGHSVTLSAYGTTVSCHNPQYKVHHTSTLTFTSITVTPINDTNWNCTTGGGDAAEVHFTECYYTFSSQGTQKHATVHFICPGTNQAHVTTPSGNMTFGTQTPTTGGAVYANVGGDVTATITAEGIHGTCHGLCQFLGTTTTSAKMSGAAIIEGFETPSGAPVHLTAT